DACRFASENAHKTLNSFRKFALATHKNYLSTQPKKKTLKSSMLTCLINKNRLLDLIFNL
ncbi:MAG: hypothetical protein R3Y36_07025, partial [Spirochaetales bacterium]